MGASLARLARHHRSIAALWWFCFLGGPVWVVIIGARIRRRRRSRELRWIV